MNVIMLFLAASTAIVPGEAPECDRFPSDRMLYAKLRDINDGFLRAEPGIDCWRGFAELVNLVEKHHGTVTPDEAHKIELEVVSRFALYSFACDYDKDPVKADFGSRLECIRGIARFDMVRSDTNTLFRVADWLAGAVPLDTSGAAFSKEAEAAFQRDKVMIYGGKTPPRYPGSLGNANHLGPAMRECRARFQFRRLYNTRLQGFRDAAIACLREAVEEGYKRNTASEREAIWDCFCRKAQAGLSVK